VSCWHINSILLLQENATIFSDRLLHNKNGSSLLVFKFAVFKNICTSSADHGNFGTNCNRARLILFLMYRKSVTDIVSNASL
jgi:hypothetical protein